MLCARAFAERQVGQEDCILGRGDQEIGVDVLIAADVELRQPDTNWPAS